MGRGHRRYRSFDGVESGSIMQICQYGYLDPITASTRVSTYSIPIVLMSITCNLQFLGMSMRAIAHSPLNLLSSESHSLTKASSAYTISLCDLTSTYMDNYRKILHQYSKPS